MSPHNKLHIARLLMAGAIFATLAEAGTSNLSLMAMLGIAVASWYVASAARDVARMPMLIQSPVAAEDRSDGA